jgi:benzodiazapine receptor
MDSVLILAAFVAANFAAGATGLLYRPGKWYRQLDKPSWRPPDWLFGPVWTVLYALIGFSGWLVWREAGLVGAALPLSVYAFQLILNAAWTPIFFGLHRPDLAFVEILLLCGSILATIVLFYPISSTAAFMLVPYLAWVSFASALTFSIWRRNGSDTAAESA